MPFIKTELPDLLVFEPVVHSDARGYFFESYNQSVFQEQGIDNKWVQDNQSSSQYGVIRGLHFQAPPHAQTKLVRVLQGCILDVAIDIRKGSPTFGKSFTVELSAENKKQLLVPKGFAHGFAVLSEQAEVLYKCDALYNKPSEQGILYTDPDLAINWMIPADRAIVSEKDKVLPRLKELDSPFIF
ncbi:MAG: dTDP-4-dehydrorhamnose 3,5-epimerase [Chitinophagia bacterium]|nr:dTDP-4-dehydrorhamnose 3,5-epimerase [Chitinophagia bacterium]